jgi:heme exporter protein B
MMRHALAITWKDLLVEFRSRQFLGAMLAFTLVTIVTLNFAFDLDRGDRTSDAAGALWIAFFFAGMLGLGRSIALERDRGTFEGLLLAPVDGGTLFLGKFLATLLSILLVQIVTLPVFAVLYNLPALHPWVIAITLVGTIGFAGLGTLFSAVAATGRAREVLLPLLLFPLLVPVLIAAVQATTLVFQGERDEILAWFNLLVAFDVIFVTLAYLGFSFVVEE